LALASCPGCQHGGAITGWLDEKRNSMSASLERLNPFLPPPPPSGPADSLVLRGDRIELENAPVETGDYTLAGAHELYRRADYEHAEKVFHHIAENKKNQPTVAEEARFYEAECLRRQGHYPKAADTYARMLTDFHSGRYREQ